MLLVNIIYHTIESTEDVPEVGLGTLPSEHGNGIGHLGMMLHCIMCRSQPGQKYKDSAGCIGEDGSLALEMESHNLLF